MATAETTTPEPFHLTPAEIAWLERSPEALHLVIDYHEVQATEADSIGEPGLAPFVLEHDDRKAVLNERAGALEVGRDFPVAGTYKLSHAQLRERLELALWALTGNQAWLGSTILDGGGHIACYQPAVYRAPDILRTTIHRDDPWATLRQARAILEKRGT